MGEVVKAAESTIRDRAVIQRTAGHLGKEPRRADATTNIVERTPCDGAVVYCTPIQEGRNPISRQVRERMFLNVCKTTP